MNLAPGPEAVLTRDLAWVPRPVELAGESWVGLVPMITVMSLP